MPPATSGASLRRPVLRTLPDDHAERAYDALAPGYDDLTRGHDHERWAALLESRAREAGLSGARLLDVACGTGNTMLPMLERGYDVTGVDVSDAMLSEARSKTAGRVRLMQADMRNLPALGAFDLVWCLGDALNYVDTAEQLASTLAGFERNLAPDGIVVFDVNTLNTFRVLYSSLYAVPSEDRIVLLEGRGSRELAPGGAADSWIDRLEPGESGWWSRTRSEHHHRHHPEALVRDALAGAGLEPHEVYGSYTSGVLETPLDELRHAKAVYIARRQAPRDR
jgi:ubiquinone/menaquinone biosynthesis C-methylase UbiE